MYIWTAITHWICCCCLPCCKSKNNENQNEDQASNDSNENTPLLATAPSSSFSEDRRAFLKSSEKKINSPSLTSGYTDFLHSNKALRLFVFHAVIYYAVAVLLFSFLLETNLSIISSLYFATVLFTTIGYGDIAPTTDLSCFATMALSTYGIVILGIFLGIYGEMVLDHHTHSESEQQAQVRKNVCEAMNKSTRALSAINEQDSLETPATAEGLGLNQSTASAKAAQKTPGNSFSALETSFEAPPMSTISSEFETEEFVDEPARSSMLQSHIAANMKKNEGSVLGDILLFFVDELPILTLVTLIGLLIGHFEKWSIVRSVYWTFISGTTIGLGDEAPENEYARLGCIVFLPLCVAVLGEVLSRIAGIYLSRKRQKSQAEFFSRALSLSDLETMDTDKDGQVDKSEFMAYMLVALQLVQKDDIDEINQLFKTLDKDHSGCLHKADLQSLNWNNSMSRTIADVATSTEFRQLNGNTVHGRRASVAKMEKHVDALRRWADKARRPTDKPHLPGGPTALPRVNNTPPLQTTAVNAAHEEA